MPNNQAHAVAPQNNYALSWPARRSAPLHQSISKSEIATLARRSAPACQSLVRRAGQRAGTALRASQWRCGTFYRENGPAMRV